MTKRPALSRDKGFALLIVLWGLVIPSLVATRVMTAGRMEAQLTSNLRDAAVAEEAANGAIHRTIFNLLGAGDVRWPPAGQFRATVADTPVEITIQNLTGRINPNLASPETLRALFGVLGLDRAKAEALTAAIVEWRARGPRPIALKIADYVAAGRSEGPPERPFRSVADLGAVLGMTPDLLARLRPLMTVAWENDPDPAYASPPVLTVLRALGGGTLPASPADRPVNAVRITATATGPNGARFTREAEAIVTANVAGPDWRILTWTTPHL